jgi:hypothetical protein
VGTRHTLLETPPERVPHEFAQAVIDFCKPLDVIAGAYVGLTQVAVDFQRPSEQLAAAFELVDEGEANVELVAERFYDSMPAEVQAGGCNIVGAGGAAAWAEKAQRVFTRAARRVP